MDNNGRDFWRCFAGSLFGFALALVWLLFGPGAFFWAAFMTILGGIGGWFFGRVFS
jgi:hypothetical protein